MLVFRISILEAKSVDPQQRFVLDVGYRAIHGGYEQKTSLVVRHQLMHSNVGVFVGCEPSGLRDDKTDINVYSASGTALSIASGRLAYTLGLVGPCYSVDTACASSLVALHSC